MRAETTWTHGGAAETLLTSSHGAKEAAATKPPLSPVKEVKGRSLFLIRGAEMLRVVKLEEWCLVGWARVFVCFLTRFRHRTWNQNPKLSQLLLGAG